MEASLSAVTVSNMVELIVVVTADMRVHFFRFIKKEHSLALVLIHKIDLGEL